MIVHEVLRNSKGQGLLLPKINFWNSIRQDAQEPSSHLEKINSIINAFQMPKRKENLTKRDVYCTGPLLNAVQIANVFHSSDTFVHKKMKFAVPEVLSNFHNLRKNYGGRRPAHEALKLFVEENFEDANELETWQPPDWRPSPTILEHIKDDKLRTWADELNSSWKSFGRILNEDVKIQPDLYSIIQTPHSFIAPSGRMKENCYWDNLWVINGLLVCDMYISAKDMLNNLFYLVNTYGYVPTGFRVYYEGRSALPGLGMAMESYFKYTLDFEFIRENIDTFEKEVMFWRKNRSVIVRKKGVEYEVFHYHVKSSEGPRPEAYREDLQSGMLANTKKELEEHFTNIKSASESGWSFSTRWFVVHGFNHGNRSNTATPFLIPVDLNAFMHKNFVLLQNWYTRIGNREKAREYWVKSEELLTAIEHVLWNKKVGIWQDYDYKNEIQRNYFYLSNFTPLLTKSYRWKPDALTMAMVKYLNKYNMDRYDGGLPASNEYSGEMWDFPNAWPPLQYLVIKGLDLIGTPVASELAFHFAEKFIHANFKAYNEHGTIFPSYDCLIPGRYGLGVKDKGTYSWTLGVIFDLFKRWGSEFNASEYN